MFEWGSAEARTCGEGSVPGDRAGWPQGPRSQLSTVVPGSPLPYVSYPQSNPKRWAPCYPTSAGREAGFRIKGLTVFGASLHTHLSLHSCTPVATRSACASPWSVYTGFPQDNWEEKAGAPRRQARFSWKPLRETSHARGQTHTVLTRCHLGRDPAFHLKKHKRNNEVTLEHNNGSVAFTWPLSYSRDARFLGTSRTLLGPRDAG